MRTPPVQSACCHRSASHQALILQDPQPSQRLSHAHVPPRKGWMQQERQRASRRGLGGGSARDGGNKAAAWSMNRREERGRARMDAAQEKALLRSPLDRKECRTRVGRTLVRCIPPPQSRGSEEIREVRPGNGRQPPLSREPAGGRTPPNANANPQLDRASVHASVAIGVRRVLDHVADAVLILCSVGHSVIP